MMMEIHFVDTTSVDGTYSFVDLPPGGYQVVEEDPLGYISVVDTDGGDENSTTVSVAAGENLTGIDFVDKKVGSISGTILEDTDADDLGDVAESAVLVSLLYLDDSPVLDGNGDAFTATTGLDGTYNFNNIPPGDYQVVASDPVNFGSVSDTDGGDENITFVTIVSTEDITGIDFVDRKEYSVFGNVFQ